MRFTGCEVEEINLVEGIVRFAFALEYERFAIRRKIAFATSFALKSQLSGIGQELEFPGWRWGGGGPAGTGGQTNQRDAKGPFPKSQIHLRKLVLHPAAILQLKHEKFNFAKDSPRHPAIPAGLW